MTYYTGATVSALFMERWRSARHTGAARPYFSVQVRHGRLLRSYHADWPDPQFGQIAGRSIDYQWYPDWTPLDDWVDLPSVESIDLDQSFDKNGSTVATITVDNVAWAQKTGVDAVQYHARDRGVLWPWRGWTPPNRPGSGIARNQWYDYLPNAQIQIRQGYGPDTAIKTFTGLIDTLEPGIRPDKMTLTARDFGGVLADCDLFGWNKDKSISDPITFIPSSDSRLGLPGTHRWIIVNDATEIVMCCLRWAGFKEWQIQPSGVPLSAPFQVDKGQTYMDVIKTVATQLGYVFLIGEPTEDDDLSIGVPIFRPSTVVIPALSQPIAIPSNRLLTDIRPRHDNASDRYIIRVRGTIDKKNGRTLGGDTFKRFNFAYWPPWIKNMSGVIKQLTYYNLGDQGTLGFTSNQQCAVAAVLIAIQIALARDTVTCQTPGQPALGLDSFAYITDPGSGIASRVYVTNRKSVMHIGGDGASQQKSPYGSGGSSSSELLWATEFGGALCDNPEWEHLTSDYVKAISGQKVVSWGVVGYD